MASVKVRFFVDELTNVMLGLPTEGYDEVKLYRADAIDGVYAEITGPGTRVTLVAEQTVYEYIDATAPTADYWYRTAYFNSTTLDEGSQSAPIQGSVAALYVTIQDIRDEGIPVEELSDERALALSLGWQSWFEHQTGMWFYPREMEFLLDGNGSRVMWLPIPIIELTELYINGDFDNVVVTTEYTVYNRQFPSDDRKNPRIKLSRAQRTIFQSSRHLVFETGDQNQKLVGTFGFVEEDGSVPFAVKRAIMILISATSTNMADGDIDAMRMGLKIEEVTDRHRIAFSDLADELGVWSPTGFREVDMALQMYRRPATIDMARTWAV